MICYDDMSILELAPLADEGVAVDAQAVVLAGRAADMRLRSVCSI